MFPFDNLGLLYFQLNLAGLLHETVDRSVCVPGASGSSQPPLKPLHADHSLVPLKLATYGKLSDKQLIDSLKPGQLGSLKVRPDGTMVDGHHRIKILRDRGIDVDSLPRETVPKDPIGDPP